MRTFINLTEPHELFPYPPHLATTCAHLGIDLCNIEYYNFPIRDHALPASAVFVCKIMVILRDTEKCGRVAAVHCRGGIGCTGLIVGCWLIESGHTRDGMDTLRMMAEEWKGVKKCKHCPYSPKMEPQSESVCTWIREKPTVAAATVEAALNSGVHIGVQ